MASNSTISIGFKIADAGGIKQLTVDADGLRKIMEATVTESEKLNKSFLAYSSLSTGINNFTNTITELHSAMSELTGYYAAQIEAETKLAVNMRNTMGATEEEIQSIKDLCSAQQELGVVGDEVQLAGAQELATYLSQKESLEQLIPVMNDMLVQQYGLNASQENAAQIATMLGKVMDGQTGALKRYGYTFDDAQEQILKYGTEAQRAAVLTDVVSASVGGMNAEMAKTDAGKMQQTANWIGDIKEKLGGMVQDAMPLLAIASNATIALGGIAKLAQGVKTAVGCFGPLKNALNSANTAINAFSKSTVGAGIAAKALSLTLKTALISTGVGAAVWVLGEALAFFAGKADKAAASTENLTEAQQKAKQAAEERAQQQNAENAQVAQARALLEIHISKLKEFNGSKAQEQKLVNEMNNTYGDTMGKYKSVSQWYETLTKNSEAYCRQMVLEARARIVANRIAERVQTLSDKGIKIDEPQAETNPKPAGAAPQPTPTPAPAAAQPPAAVPVPDLLRGGTKSPIKKALEQATDSPVKVPVQAEFEVLPSSEQVRDAMVQIAQKELQKERDELAGIMALLGEIKFDKSGAGGGSGPAPKTYNEKARTLEEYCDNLSYLDEALKKVNPAETKQIENLRQKRIETEKNIKVLRELLGLEENHGKDRAAGEKVKSYTAGSATLAPSSIDPGSVVPEQGPFDMAGDAADAYRQRLEKMRNEMGLMTGAAQDMASIMGSLSGVVGEGAGAWLNYGAKVVGMIAEVLPQILALTSAQWAEALSAATGSAASLPFPFNIVSIGASVAAVLAAMASVPKFADGGIAYGPTLGLFGEYAGASTNPEVVAPLSELTKLLRPAEPSIGGKVVFRFERGALVGYLERERLLNARS